MTEIENRVLKIISPYCKNTDALKSVQANSRLLQDLGVNSARLVDIILEFEDEFSIAIDDATADSVRTYGDAISMVRQMTERVS